MSHALAFVGSLNRPVPYQARVSGCGISVFDYDPDSGALALLSETTGIDNPGFIALHPHLPVLYAATEVYGWHEALVAAYRIDAARGRLVYLNMQPTLGSIAAHLALSPDGRQLYVANYRDGAPGDLPGQSIAMLPVRADGGLDPACAGTAHAGSGPQADRQEGPHPHCVQPSPDGRTLAVCDLGTDEVIAYRFDPDERLFERLTTLAMRPGTGPRHVVWYPDGATLYVNGELDQTVSVLRWERGVLRCVQTLPTLPATFAGTNSTADLYISADGRFVYCSNRGHDSIAAFAIQADATLHALGTCFTGGATPRGFCLDPTGRFLLATNQASDTLTVLPRDGATGLLSPPVHVAAVGTPMCVRVWRP